LQTALISGNRKHFAAIAAQYTFTFAASQIIDAGSVETPYEHISAKYAIFVIIDRRTSLYDIMCRWNI